MLRALVVSLCVSLPLAAAAVPITFEIDSTAPESGTDHFYASLSLATGTLTGDLEGDVLSGIQGDIFIRHWGQTAVLDGTFDFSGTSDSWFLADGLGTFDVVRTYWDGHDLLFWSHKTLCGSWGCKSHWLRFRGRVDPTIPEPSAALLFGVGAVVVSRRVRRG